MSVSSFVPSGAARAVTEAGLRDPVRASQHIFRVVLDALANPGTVCTGIVHPRMDPEGVQFNPWLTSILLTMLDHEVSLHVTPCPGALALADFMARRTRTTLTDAASATFVAAQSDSLENDLPELLKRGSLEYPDDGATLLVEVKSLDQGLAGDLELSLTGPGIKSVQHLRLAGISSAFLHSRDRANSHYPMGIDILLIDGTGRVVGLPRTTELTIYAEGAR